MAHKQTSFGAELVESAQEALDIARGESRPAFVHVPERIDVAAIRKRQGLSQTTFATRYGLSPSAVRDWEQERRAPDRAARILLAVIDVKPDAVCDALREFETRKTSP